MLVFSKPCQYALKSMAYIIQQSPDKVCQVGAIAKNEDIPKPFLSKVLKQLVDSGILKSHKGPGGGFSLNINPEKITLYEFIDSIDNIGNEFTKCGMGWEYCNDKQPCPIHNQIKAIREEFLKQLNGTKLSDFLKQKN